MILIKKLVQKKEKAFSLGTKKMNELKGKLNEYVSSFVTDNYKDKYIGCNIFDITKIIYEDSLFYDYLKYSFIGKHYERLLTLIEFLIFIAFILVGVLLYNIIGFGALFIILCIILFVALIIVLKLIRTGESYKSYYNRTFYSLLLNSFLNIKFSINNRQLEEYDIKSIIDKKYTKTTKSKNIDGDGSLCSVSTCDLRLVNETERTLKNGTTSKSTDIVFNGFYIKIKIKNSYNKLKGNTIKILEDETLFSSITEDTVKGIYESDLEFNFNLEELNKAFDCKVTGYNGFVDADDIMLEVHKIITPSFEQHLLYLKNRYNTFNMNISDDGLILSFNLKKNFFQKAKDNDAFDLVKTYKESNNRLRLLNPTTTGIEDFTYYNVFPFMERLYLLNYLTYLYLSYMDFENFYDSNNNLINSYEESMKNMYDIKNKEFRTLYTERIKEVYKNTKENLKEM